MMRLRPWDANHTPRIDPAQTRTTTARQRRVRTLPKKTARKNRAASLSSQEKLPVAVNPAVAVVIAAAAIAAPVAMVGNAQDTLDAADRATDAGADRAADHATHRTGDPVAFTGAVARAADHALRMRQMR